MTAVGEAAAAVVAGGAAVGVENEGRVVAPQPAARASWPGQMQISRASIGAAEREVPSDILDALRAFLANQLRSSQWSERLDRILLKQ